MGYLYMKKNNELFDKRRFTEYSVTNYAEDLSRYGLEETWVRILSSIHKYGENDFLNVSNFSNLYEIGLAYTNKIAKRETGKYFTPSDVASVMAEWLQELPGTNVADVCCGVGNLILAYLKRLPKEQAEQMLKEKRIYLYDADPVALKICCSSIAILFGSKYLSNLNVICSDFLDSSVSLPSDCKVICNPPYAHILAVSSSWDSIDVASESKDLYAPIMDKILKQSAAGVIITPYSFISGSKFKILRRHMDKRNGFIVNFDNVPANIFSGRKRGIFNSNSTNSIRAAITVIRNDEEKQGFAVSPMIRFKSEERERLLKCSVLESFVSWNYQRISDVNPVYCKCFASLEITRKQWNQISDKTLGDYIFPRESRKVVFCFPNSCRYSTVATIRDLDRSGKYYLPVSDYEDAIFCWLNSSFTYWYWRLYDGGINYSLSLLLSMPVYFSKLSKVDLERLHEIAEEMQRSETQYLTYKKNASKMQENVKFPERYRKQIDEIYLHVLDEKYTPDMFDCIHANTAFGKERVAA